MDDENPIPASFHDALEVEDWERVEELWLEALGESPPPTAALLEVRRRLSRTGPKSLALTLLELLAESLEAGDDHAGALAALRDLVRLTPKPPRELRLRLEAALRKARASSPSFEAVLAHHPVADSRRPVDELDTVLAWLDHDRGTVVEVVGQGVGRVVELNLELDNVRIDLGGTRPVSVPFGALAKYVRRLPEGDFRRRRVEGEEGLAAFVESSPGEALVEVLASLGEPADVAAIRGALDQLLPAARWTSWWAKARKHPRVLTSGSGSRLRYALGDSEEEAAVTLLAELEAATPRDRLVLARRLAGRGPEAASAASEVLGRDLPRLVADDPGLAWETASLLAGLPDGASLATETKIGLAVSAPAARLLAGIRERGARAEALEALRRERSDEWVSLWREWILHEEHPANLDLLARELVAVGAEEALDTALEAVFRTPLARPAQLVWACEAMVAEEAPAALRQRLRPSLLEILPDTLTRTEFSAVRARAKALLEGGQVAIRLILEGATREQAERFVARVARAPGVEPQRVRLLEQALGQRGGDGVAEEGPGLVASRAAVEAKRAELKELLEVEIPRTLKGINAAAAEGDLRENFEYHMLRDRQELLSARAAKLQQELAVVRILEPGVSDTSKVNIGTVVHFATADGRTVEPVTILGPWDAALERRIFADQTGLAGRLLGRRVGDEVEIDDTLARIARIEAWSG